MKPLWYHLASDLVSQLNLLKEYSEIWFLCDQEQIREELSFYYNMRLTLFLEKNPHLLVKNNLKLVNEVSFLMLWSENLIYLFFNYYYFFLLNINLCSCQYLSFVIIIILNCLLPLSNLSLLGHYATGSGNSKQILIPHSGEVTGLHTCATTVNKQLKDLVKLMSWKWKSKILNSLGDIRAWTDRFSIIYK